MPSIKQIGTICFAFYFIIFPNFTFADNITDASTCTNGVLGTYTGPADIEANFDPNTINTTWYSNGTAMSGNGVPSSCTYAAPLTPPTPADRPGYVFGGWKVKAACSLASLDSSISVAFQDFGRMTCENGVCNIPFSYGVVEVQSKCSENMGEWGAIGTPSDTSGMYCWCAAIAYTPNDGDRCSVTTPLWVYQSTEYPVNESDSSDSACIRMCGNDCMMAIAMGSASFRATLFGQTQ